MFPVWRNLRHLKDKVHCTVELHFSSIHWFFTDMVEIDAVYVKWDKKLDARPHRIYCWFFNANGDSTCRYIYVLCIRIKSTRDLKDYRKKLTRFDSYQLLSAFFSFHYSPLCCATLNHIISYIFHVYTLQIRGRQLMNDKNLACFLYNDCRRSRLRPYNLSATNSAYFRQCRWWWTRFSLQADKL